MTAVLSIDNSICCIEEPEIHIHPRLQRDFIKFITEKTSNIYFISTHSSTFINAFDNNDNVQAFHLYLEDDVSIGGPLIKEGDIVNALQE